MFSRFIPVVASVRVSFLRPSDIPLYGWAPFCVSTPHPLVSRCLTSRGTPDSFPQWPPRLPFPHPFTRLPVSPQPHQHLLFSIWGIRAKPGIVKGGERPVPWEVANPWHVSLCACDLCRKNTSCGVKHPVSVPARGLTAVLLWTNT